MSFSFPKHSMVISRTPLRISLFGGGSDYPAFYKRVPGAVLGTTINQYVYVSLKAFGDFFEHKIRVSYSKAELVNHPKEIIHPSVRECLQFKNVLENLDIHIFSDLPAKTGLGSSSAFTVGFLHALEALQGRKVSKQKLAEEACYVEQERILEHVGSQDQFHASYGGFNVIEFSLEKIAVRPVILIQEKRKRLQEHFMVFYTGLTRFASEVAKEQIEKTKNFANDETLQRMTQMVYEAEEIISDEEADSMVFKLGEMLDRSWALKKGLSSKISNDQIDLAYEKAKAKGAYGGKLCGAGSGGFLALLVPPKAQPSVREALKPFLEVPFSFESEGSSIIYMKDSL